MKKLTPLILSVLLITLVCVLTTKLALAQDPENPPLVTARNSLSNAYPDKRPILQSDFRNVDDMWLLYAPDFDYLSGNSQSYLLRKYGLLDAGSVQYRGAETTFRSWLERATRGTVVENVRVNDPALDLRERVQSETSSATSGSDIVIGYNDASIPGFGSSISYSNDGGQTWQQTFPPMYPLGRGLGDPVMAAGPDGVFYHAILAFNALGLSTIGVTKSTDGGATWSPLVNTTLSATRSFDFHDKPWLTVDNTDSPFRGNVYVSWTRFTSTPQERGINFVRSTDGGRTWSQAKLIAQSLTGLVQGSMIAIGLEGEVYVAYFASDIPGIVVVKSTDGGKTFEEPVVAIEDALLRFSRNLSGGFEILPLPSITVDTTKGPNSRTVYITTNIKPPDSFDDSDVVLVKSIDGGSTWSKPVRVNDDETDTDQFQPSLAVAPDGTLGVMWYDRRNDPINNVLLDVYMTTSSDGGKTFSPNRRVTSANWMLVPTPLTFRPAYHGDYNQMSVGDLGFVLNWADDRSGTDPDVYVTVLPPENAEKQPPDFVLSSQTLARNVLAGSSESFTIGSESLSDFEDKVSLDVGPEYPGLTYRLSSDAIKPPDKVTLTVDTAPDAKPRTYPITIIGKAGDRVRTTNLRLTVYNPKELRETPRAISGIRDSVFQPKVVVDDKGDLHVASGGDARRFFSSFGVLNYTRYSEGKQVAATEIIAVKDPNASLASHAIGIDDAGSITVIWRQFDPATRLSNIFMSRSIDQGKTFSDPVDITGNTDSRISVFSPVLAVSKKGTINVAFVQLNGITGFQDVLFTQSTDEGATFSPVVNVSNSPGPLPTAFASSPAIALDPSEAIGIVYLAATKSTRADIFFSRSIDGEDFSTPVNISRTNTQNRSLVDVFSPSIAIDGSGNINVAYIKLDRNRNEQEVYFTRSNDEGMNFTEPINASRTSILEIRSFVPRVGTDSAGNIGITWGAFVSGLIFPAGRDMFFCKSTDGGQTFSTAINISNKLGLQVAFPMVITREDEFAVLWEDETGGNNQIFLSKRLLQRMTEILREAE